LVKFEPPALYAEPVVLVVSPDDVYAVVVELIDAEFVYKAILN
jgi:hypothetical protein